MKRKRGNIVGLLVAEQAARRARTPEERVHFAADVVVVKVAAGMRLTDEDARAIEMALAAAETVLRAGRKVA